MWQQDNKLHFAATLAIALMLSLTLQAETLFRSAATTLYGTVIYSEAWEAGNDYGIYAIPVEANTTLTKVYGDQQFGVNGGSVYHNGKYYLIKGEDAGQGVNAVTVFVYDAELWELTNEIELAANFFTADLSVDPTTNTIYGICASYEGGQELCRLDFEEGKREMVGQLSQTLVALAIDATGLIYGIGTNGMLYRISAANAAMTEIGSTGITPAYVQSATFDWGTGTLYWAATTSSEMGALFLVDTTTGQASLVSRFANNEEVVGLYSLSSGKPWEGPDLPVAPSNVTLSYDGGQLSLSWDAPTTGIHGADIDPATLTYTLTRYPEGKVVAKNWTGTTFTEKYAPESLEAVYYTVLASNGELTGDAARSNFVKVGDAVLPPFIPDFADEAANSLFSAIDGDGDGYTWSIDSRSSKALLEGAPFESTNDWLVTPSIKFDSQYTYQLSFKTFCDFAANYPYSVAAYVGQGNTQESFKRELLSRQRIGDNTEQTFQTLFTIGENGSYNIGLRVYGYDIQGISLYDLKIEQGPNIASPAAPKELKAETDGLSPNVTLSFIAPTTNLAGHALTALQKIAIYRDGITIAELDATPGQQLTYTDRQAVMGQNNHYQVAAVNEAGEGQRANVVLWVGNDAPTEPVNIVLREQEGKACLTWNAPSTGQNGGYVDASSLVYGIVRSTDNQVVARDLKQTSYEEVLDQSGDQQWLVYGIQAANDLGYSKIGTSNGIIVGSPYALPFYEGFPNGSRTKFWIAENYNENGWGASWGGYTDNDADGNGGFISFGTSGGYQDSGSRLCSGKISLAGAQNPVLEYAYCHRSESQGERHPLRVSIVSNGKESVLVKENAPIYFYEIDLNNPFSHVRIPLTDFKDAEYIQIVFDAVMDETTYTYVDAVQVRDYAPHDLAATLSAPTTSATGQTLTATVNVKNVGSEKANDYKVQLYDGEQLLAEQHLQQLEADKSIAVKFEITVGPLSEQLHLQANVVYDQDEVPQNNYSDVVSVAVELPIYPAPAIAVATQTSQGIEVTWTAPDYQAFALPTTDGAEAYEAFNPHAILGEWTLIDADGQPTHNDIYAEDVHVEYEGAGEPSSWLVFNPVDRNYPTESWWGGDNGWSPVNGKQFFASVSAASGTTDDWLISPLLSGDAQTITFFEHGYYNMEKFQVLYSTTDARPQNFILLASETSSFDWTQRSYDLPVGTRYFAIRNVSSSDSYRLFVDDITFQSAAGIGALTLTGYHIYRDGLLIKTLTIDEAEGLAFTDNQASPGRHVYQVTAIYNVGESAAAAAEITVSAAIHATTAEDAVSSIYTLNGIRTMTLRPGINIVRTKNGNSRKIVMK
ncbi:MAG: choice-of-anchor J domain-containing protein [Prevotella sp.]|nr:choice-of-anchor J domain-containing protein [Prevotella sp.]